MGPLYESTTKVLATNALSRRSFEATVSVRGNTEVRPPRVERIVIGSWNAGPGLEWGEVVVHFDPHTLKGVDARFDFNVLCKLHIPDDGRRGATDGLELSDLRALPAEFGVKSEAPATLYAQADGLTIEISLFLVDDE